MAIHMKDEIYASSGNAYVATLKKKKAPAKKEMAEDPSLEGSGKPNIPYIKKILPAYHSDHIRNLILCGTYGSPSTCSSVEVTTPYSEVALAYALVYAAGSSRPMVYCNIHSDRTEAHKFLHKLGFKKVFEYEGNHSHGVTHYVIDVNGLHLHYQ